MARPHLLSRLHRTLEELAAMDGVAFEELRRHDALWHADCTVARAQLEATMATTITVLYENVDDAAFNLEYYMSKHMPLVDEKFKRFGLKSWRVLKAVGAPFGGKPAYSVIANLEFDTADQFISAVDAEGGPVFGDVPNFSNKDPVVVIADLVGATSLN